MFRANDSQQMTVYDSFLSQPAHIQRLIEKSWAKDFSDVIFPAIHEERFCVLYSDVGSLPNTPVNALVGSMLLKEYFVQTEEELLMSIVSAQQPPTYTSLSKYEKIHPKLEKQHSR